MLLFLCLLLALFLTGGCSAPPAPPPPDEPPVAEAGPDQWAVLGEEVSLDGSQSLDPEGKSLTFTWNASPDNPAPIAIAGAQARFTFVPPAVGTYWFILTVSDGENTSRPDSVKVVVRSRNRPPLADAGPDLIARPGTLIPLSAVNSIDPDGDPLTYRWQALQPPGPVAIADSTAPQTTVSLSIAGNYRFRVTVSDGTLSDDDEMVVTFIASANEPPVANAGPDQQVSVGTLVVLDGSASADPEGAPLAFRWTLGRTPGPLVQLSDSTAVQPTFIPPEAGEYVFGLVVSDGTHTSLQDVVVIRVLEQDFVEQKGMIQVLAGPFSMGSEQGAADERPPHRVELSTFWIDKYEVTTAQYQACVEAGVCTPAGQAANCNAGRTDRADHPINCLTWEQARAFCAWAGKRLPTEAEWEKAARGLDGRRFVWGDEFPTPGRMNYGQQVGATTPVGAFPGDLSFYGLFDMGGNVHEWTADYYAADYYAVSPVQDPLGPVSSPLRVVRGASWRVGFPVEALTATVRQAFFPNTSDSALGFRCARSQPPNQ